MKYCIFIDNKEDCVTKPINKYKTNVDLLPMLLPIVKKFNTALYMSVQ